MNDFSLVYTKHKSQVFACLLFNKHNYFMDIKKIRQARLKQWFTENSIPSKEKSYISQLITGKASFGEKAARRLESTYKMPSMYLDDVNSFLYGLDADDTEFMAMVHILRQIPKESRELAKSQLDAIVEFSIQKQKTKKNEDDKQEKQ